MILAIVLVLSSVDRIYSTSSRSIKDEKPNNVPVQQDSPRNRWHLACGFDDGIIANSPQDNRLEW